MGDWTLLRIVEFVATTAAVHKDGREKNDKESQNTISNKFVISHEMQNVQMGDGRWHQEHGR